jgi:glycerol-3-phosphate dehydrogenase subunit C
MSKAISYLPSEGISYDPNSELYWDEEALRVETERVFEVCNGCRMCFKYCDSFPDLFKFIDDDYDGDVGKLLDADVDKVVDGCFQCKLCDVQCPYTPRDNHEFMLDFPKLMHRHRAQRGRKNGFSIREQVLGDPNRLGRLARSSLGLANTMNRVSVHRWFMEKMLGIHREKLLPDFAGTTFERWATQEGRTDSDSATDADTVLFPTCYVENNEPQIGRDTIEVLEHNGFNVACTKGLSCCGMPAWEHGDLETLRQMASKNLDILLPHVEAGRKIVAINPTCSMMMRREYPELVAEDEKERAQALAEAIVDPGELVWSIRKEDQYNSDFKSSPNTKVAYHAPCHLRAQAVGFRGRDLIKKIPGVSVGAVMECCGHDGTYAMTTEGFEPSQRHGARSFEGMKAVETEIWATDCPLAAVQFEQHAGVRPMHPMTILAKAYREDGFSKEE